MSFADLKKLILVKLQEQGHQNLDDSVAMFDEKQYKYLESDKIADHLQQNSVINLIMSENANKQVEKKDEQDQKHQTQQQDNNSIQQLQNEVQVQQQQIQNSSEEQKDQQQNQGQEEIQQEDQIIDINNEQVCDENPKEAIVVVYDISGSMQTQFCEGLPRIGAVNAFFSAFADKTLAFEYNHVVSLYWFDDRIEKKCDFIKDMNLFIKLVDDANPRGSTKLYDALQTAVEALKEIKKQYPEIILRIIAMTDGEDNASKCTPQAVAQQIVENKIILDSFVVGTQCASLKTVTHASGGRCYCPADLNIGLKLFEIETILSARARGEQVVVNDGVVNLESLKNKPFDQEGIQVSYQADMNQGVEDVQSIIKKFQEKEKNNSSNNQQSSQAPSKGNMKRLIKELEQFGQDGQNKNVKIFPQADDINKWKVLMIGPEGSVYNNGIYTLFVEIPNDYPFKPPKVRFVTPIYHCNLSDQGRMCLDILSSNWSPALSISKVFINISEMLLNPNAADALDSNIGSFMMLDNQLYQKKALEHVKANANKPIDELVKDIVGQNVNEEDDIFKQKKEEIQKWSLENRKQQQQ